MRFTAAPATVATLVQEVDQSLVRGVFCCCNFFCLFLLVRWEEWGASQWQWGQGRLFEVGNNIFWEYFEKYWIFDRCGTKVFLMDMVRGKSGLYHKQCLSCATCKLVLTILSRSNSMICSIWYKDWYGHGVGFNGTRTLLVCWLNISQAGST